MASDREDAHTQPADAGAQAQDASGHDAPRPEVPRDPTLRQKLGFALQGIRYGIVTQVNVRIDLIVAICVVAAGILLRVPPHEFVVLLLTCGAQIAAELSNTAIECVVDLVSPEWHPLAKAAKDTAAGAALVLAIFAAIIGVTIFGRAVLALL